MTQPIIRMCTRCKAELPIERFSRDRSRVDGLSKWCKGCVAENGRKHYQTNRDTVLERQRTRRVEDSDRVRAVEQAKRERNREQRNTYNRQRYEAKRDEILAKSKERHRLKKYRLTSSQFAALLAAQDGVCAICAVEATRWHIDHDHDC